MKKIRVLITILLAFLGAASSSAYAIQTLVNELPPDHLSDMTSDEETFAGELDDQNREKFAQMPSEKRREAMEMVAVFNDTGGTLSPDEAVDKVASTLNNKD